MFRISISILFALCFLINCNEYQSKKLFAEEEVLYKQGKYEEAINLMDLAIKNDPKNIGAYINRGTNKSALQDFEGAIIDYQKVLELDPHNKLALYNIGNNYKRLGKPELSIENYNNALKLKDNQKFIIEITPEESFDSAEFYVSIHEIAFERGIAYYDLGKFKNAFQDFNYALDKNYYPAECHYWLGLVYYSCGEKEKACNEFQIAKQMNDKEAEEVIAKYCID